MEQNKNKIRFNNLDFLRGVTVILMIVFHFSFDLNYFNIISFDIINHPFWYFFPRLIVFLFFFAVGISLKIVHGEKIDFKVFSKRLLIIIFWATVISLVTLKLFPENWIYFGTLHAIAIISIMSLPFLKRPRLSLILAICLFTPSILIDKTLPWISLSHVSWDYISPFPWVGASFLGIFAAHKRLHKHPIVFIEKNSVIVKSLNYLGRHTLIIYLIHQPILMGILYSLKNLFISS